jgi:hypothetical protein
LKGKGTSHDMKRFLLLPIDSFTLLTEQQMHHEVDIHKETDDLTLMMLEMIYTSSVHVVSS